MRESEEKKAKEEAEKMIREGQNDYQIVNGTGLDMTQISAIRRVMGERGDRVD